MPTYSYRCTHCDHRFDVVQKFTDAALTECPECGQPLRKIYHAAGVVFKGSGWYINDSRPATASTAKKGESSAKSETSDNPKPDTASDKTSEKSEKPAKAEPAAKSVAAD